MKMSSVYRVLVRGVAYLLLPNVQAKARELGLDARVVTLDANRQETRVNCDIRDGVIVPVVPNFMPRAISYGLPAKDGTAAVAIDLRRDGKMETRVFRPRNSFLFFRSGMVFNLFQRVFEVFYLGAERMVEEKGECWHLVYKQILQYTLPCYIVSDAQMREHLRERLTGKVLESHLAALDELTLNPVIPTRERRDQRQPNVGLSEGQQERAGQEAALQKGGNNRGRGNHPRSKAE